MDPLWISDIVAHWGVTLSGPVDALAQGTVFRFASELGDDLVLKQVGSVDDLVVARLGFEYDVLLHVHKAGLPVALPLRDLRGRIAVPWEGHIYCLSPCLPSSAVVLTDPEREMLFHNYGVMIAEMHRALATFPATSLQDRAGRTELVSEVFGIGGPIITSYLSGCQEAVFRAMLADLAPRMRAAFRGLPEQLIHRDCHSENLLSCGTGVTGIVDWDHLIVGPRVLDIAYFAVQHAKRDVRDAGKMAQWFHDLPRLVRGYTSVSALSPQEQVALPLMMIAVPILFAHWAISINHDAGYIQQELEAAAWLYDNLDAIQRQV